MISQAERARRIREAYAREQDDPERWFWMSFAGDEGFLGVIIIRARGIASALELTHELGINPGGSVAFHELFDNVVERNVPEAYRGRLLTSAEIEELGR